MNIHEITEGDPKSPPRQTRKYMACEKCGSDCEKPGSSIMSAGELHYLCNFCSLLLDKIQITDALYHFLQSNGHEFVKSPVSRNMLLARMRRSGLVIKVTEC